MENRDAESHKPFFVKNKEEAEIENPKYPNEVTTLPSIVTICLAPCANCSGEYIDITNSFRLRCCCPCHTNKRDTRK
jgi:hypothetical protein